jgi:two-component system cell cycle sensor histidine kinase/response regulator CckA
LEQVIINLGVNARDAMPGGGTITLTTSAVSAADVRTMGADILPIGDYIRLTVSDTGKGIAPEIQGKIFEPFFTTKDVGKGTGLGLSTVYGIIKQSGGFIFVDSPPGSGATFAIYFPVHRAEAGSAEEPDDASASRISQRREYWGTGRILLVEDEDMVRAVAQRALSRQGYEVVGAIDGEDGLEKLAHEPRFDLLISDVMMPNMDGPTMARQARKAFPDLPILFMSGYAENELRQSINLPEVAFLPKPFSVEQIAAAVGQILQQKEPE